MGLILSVYRNAELGDCTNGGLTSRVNKVTVVNASGPFEPTDERPAVLLVKGPLNTARLVPIDLVDSGAWVMSGGNYAGTSDSRFGEAVRALIGSSNGVVPVFDRTETQEEYNRLTI